MDESHNVHIPYCTYHNDLYAFLLYTWIVVCGELLDIIIVGNEIPITDMPHVQQITLYTSQLKVIVK